MVVGLSPRHPAARKVADTSVSICASSRATASASSSAPEPDPRESPTADLMGQYLNRRGGQTFQSIPVIVFFTRDMQELYRYIEFPAGVPQDRIRAAQTAAKPGETPEQTRERAAREFAELQASPFFQLWRDAAQGRVDQHALRAAEGGLAGVREAARPVTTLSVIARDVPSATGPTRSPAAPATCTTWRCPAWAHGKILRARHPHARIVRIDTTRRRPLPGCWRCSRRRGRAASVRLPRDQVALKTDRVRCVRDEVAAVAAESAPSPRRRSIS